MLGSNGIGKSTIVKIYADEIIPNFGNFDLDNDPTIPQTQKKKHITIKYQDNEEKKVLEYFKGTETYNFFKDLYQKKIKVAIKKQSLKEEPSQKVLDSIHSLLLSSDNQEIYYELDIEPLLKIPYDKLSGGQKQRLMIFLTMIQNVDLYIFDEPTNYLDITQRLKIGKLIRKFAEKDKMVLVVDHDITIMDYIADVIHILYGVAGAYGIVSSPISCAEAINQFFEGYLSNDNVRFRQESYSYQLNLDVNSLEDEKKDDNKDDDNNINEGIIKQIKIISYPDIEIKFPESKFTLNVPSGSFSESSSVNIILGENDSGKTTFLKWLSTNQNEIISIKPQYPEEMFNNPKYQDLTTQELISELIPQTYGDMNFQTNVIRALDISGFDSTLLRDLSGGELQKLALIITLGKNAKYYLFDEPSASLDIEERVKVIKVIKRFLVHNQKIGFIVEHDIAMAFSLIKDVESHVIVFQIENNLDEHEIKASSSLPLNGIDGLQMFLKTANITFRMGLYSKFKRYRINRLGSSKDIEQKREGKYIV